MRVAVYAIALNEEKFVARFTESCRGADLVVVGDTGSTDGTGEALLDAGASVMEVRIKPWRFDDARNAVLARLPADLDVCISLDLDEVLAPGWRAALEASWTSATTQGDYLFAWSHKPDGSPAVQYHYDKVHSRFGWRWKNACHEYPVRDPRLVNVKTWLPGFEVHHWPDPTKPRAQYLGLLELTAKEDPRCPRTAHYLAREYFFNGRPLDAFAEFKRHLAMPDGWRYERCASMRYLAKIQRDAGNLVQAVWWAEQACAEAPDLRDPWVDLAEMHYHGRDWMAVDAAARQALTIASVPEVYMNDPRSFGAAPHDFLSLAEYNLGHTHAALKHAMDALSFEPEDGRLRANVNAIRAELEPETDRPKTLAA